MVHLFHRLYGVDAPGHPGFKVAIIFDIEYLIGTDTDRSATSHFLVTLIASDSEI